MSRRPTPQNIHRKIYALYKANLISIEQMEVILALVALSQRKNF